MKKCSNITKCSIYNTLLKNNNALIKIYKHLYCEAGLSKIESCKRYQVTNRIGYCPSGILPSTQLSVDEIVSRVKI